MSWLSEDRRQALTSALLLAAFAATGGAILALANQGTRARIEANEREVVVRQLRQVMPVDLYDNDLLTDTVTLTLPETISPPGPDTIHRARLSGAAVAAILPVTAPNGYNGAINLLVGVRYDGTVEGVRVVSHRETPGLGDGIDSDRTDWAKQFGGASLERPAPERWKVRKDGGDFDQLTGATITPRAVVKAVRGALQYFAEHRQEIFNDSQ